MASILTKNPISPSISGLFRLAVGVPITMSACPESLDNTAAQAAIRAETARREADELLSDARARAQQMVEQAREAAERNRTSSQSEVDELMHQRDEITEQLDDLRGLLGLASKTPPRQQDSEDVVDLTDDEDGAALQRDADGSRTPA